MMFSTLMISAALVASPACVDVFDEVEDTIQQNYVALALYQVNAPALAEAAAARHASYRQQAARIAADDVLECTRVLQGYVRSYGDPHLFLNSSPVMRDADAAQRRASSPTVAIGTTRLRRQAVSATGRGPLVGVWAAEGFEAAIIPEADGEFTAVVLESESEFWNAGDVAARFRQRGEEFEAILYRAEDRAPIRTDYEIVSDRILSMPPANWGRIAPQPQGVMGEWDPHNPRAPRFEMTSDNVAWLSIPSLSPDSIGDSLQVIAEEHRDDIIGADLLVVDLRGNNGGSSSAIAPLDPFIMTHENRDDYAVDPYSPVLLSSPDTVAYYSRIVDQMPPGLERDVFADLVRRLEENPASLQPMLTHPDHIALYNDPRVPEGLFEQPENVAILVDGDVMSAGEAVLLRAGQSRRVTSFGVSTRGAIDYQSVLMVAVGDGDLRFALGYPLMADNPLLPAGGYNQGGVPVDVPLQGAQASWPEQILTYYGLR